MAEAQHEHVFVRAALTYASGQRIENGRRCACGMEVVGDGPFAVNADLVRAGEQFNRGVAEAFGRIAEAMNASTRRRFPR